MHCLCPLLSKMLRWLPLLALLISTTHASPNIIFVLVDDVGWADFGYNTNKPPATAIPTPNLDRLAGQGVKLKSHYVHSSCTPSRASLMTGRYASNVGLPYALVPGSVGGIPDSMATIPQLIRRAGYSAHMVGKWHIGDAQWKQSPVGKGFESHVGSLLWGLDSYSKQIWFDPFNSMGIDWGKYYENGTYFHYSEPRHATIALTDEALAVMKNQDKEKPLFLYVSYNAAHAPLQAEPEWLSQCQHIPHTWRRQYCGLMVGFDQAVDSLVKGAKEHLGEDTVIVVTSDNGGIIWNGGLNEPLRGVKMTPFEGGTKVPGFVVDLSEKYAMTGGREMDKMVHISDWMPTFLSWAGASHLYKDLKLDGIDQSQALLKNEKVRDNMLLELWTEAESHDGSSSAAYRKGQFKLIQGTPRDPNWYTEPKNDRVSSSDPSWFPAFMEFLIKGIQAINGVDHIDEWGQIILNFFYFKHYTRQEGFKTMLFDIESDPEERNDISSENPEVVADLLKDVERIKAEQPPSTKYWMVSPNWTTAAGDCPDLELIQGEKHCKFLHSWIPDHTDLTDKALGLETVFKNRLRTTYLGYMIAVILSPTVLILIFSCVWVKNKLA